MLKLKNFLPNFALYAQLLLAFSASAQGLRGEHNFNDNYRHRISGMACSGDNTFVIHNLDQFNVGWSLQRTKLSLINPQGVEIWEVPAVPQAGEVYESYGIVDDGNNGVTYLCGSPQGCDYSNYFSYVIRNVNENGEIVWEYTWYSLYASFYNLISGFTKDNSGKYLMNYSDDATYGNIDTSSVIILNENGTLHSIFSVDQYDLNEIRFGSAFYIMGTNDNKLFGFNNQGETVSTIEFTEPIKNFVVHNNAIYVLTSTSIYKIDQNFDEVVGTSFSQYSVYSNLKIVENQIQFLSLVNDNYTIVVLDDDLNLLNTKPTNASLSVGSHLDYNETHFTMGSYHALFFAGSGWLRDYALNDTQSIEVNRTDIGISDIEFTNFTLENASSSTPGVKTLNIYADVKITNYGDKTLNTCRVNYRQGYGIICGYRGFSQELTNLNIAPGASTWISLGLIHNETNLFGPNPSTGQFTRNICVYTSHPNQQADTIVNNDAYCKTLVFGYLDLEENVLNPLEKKLVKIVDLLGREIEYGTNQLMIYIYDDGSSEKIFVSE